MDEACKSIERQITIIAISMIQCMFHEAITSLHINISSVGNSSPFVPVVLWSCKAFPILQVHAKTLVFRVNRRLTLVELAEGIILELQELNLKGYNLSYYKKPIRKVEQGSRRR